MEKEIKNQLIGSCKVHACFEQPQTLKILNFLEANQKRIIYKGISEDQGRRQKDFPFQSVSFLSEKLKHIQNPIIKQGIDSLLKGQSNTVLILGNEQSKKEKMLIGQSQNPGFLLRFLSQLFQTCYQKELEDKVTIKISCWEHKEGKISDLLDGTGAKSGYYNWIASDLIEGDIIVGVPEIIIRNMKSALKVIRIFMRRLEQNREKGLETENLVFTAKLQIDSKYDKQGNVVQYQMPKFHIVKLAVPHIKSSSKHASWFITLYNYLQSKVLERVPKSDENMNEDEFSLYLRDTLVRRASKLNCLSILSNKMSANDCLTMLKFSSYLQQTKLDSRLCYLNLSELNQKRVVLQGQLLKSFNQQRSWVKSRGQTWLTTQQYSLSLDFQLIATAHRKLMQAHNMLEYQYANLLTIGCDKLQKYIFNQEVEDYFYAKKIMVQTFPQLQIALSRYMQLRRQTKQNQIKYLKKMANITNRLKKQQNEAKLWKYLLNSKIKAKSLYQKLFQIYGTMSTHFLYQKDDNFLKQMKPSEQQQILIKQQPPLNTVPINIDKIITKMEQKVKVNIPPSPSTVIPKQNKKKKAVDEIELMFTNPNASLCGHRFRT